MTSSKYVRSSKPMGKGRRLLPGRGHRSHANLSRNLKET